VEDLVDLVAGVEFRVVILLVLFQLHLLVGVMVEFNQQVLELLVDLEEVVDLLVDLEEQVILPQHHLHKEILGELQQIPLVVAAVVVPERQEHRDHKDLQQEIPVEMV
jgi:hypothetical protein